MAPGGARNPKGMAIFAGDVVRSFPAPGPGGKWNYRTIEAVELANGTIRYRCIDPACVLIVFKTAAAAAQHRGVEHPGESPRRGKSPKGQLELVEAGGRAELAEPPVLKRQGRPAADPLIAEDAFLDAAAPSIGASVTAFIDQLIESRQRAIDRANVAEAKVKRMRDRDARIKHHLSGLFNELQRDE